MVVVKKIFTIFVMPAEIRVGCWLKHNKKPDKNYKDFDYKFFSLSC